MGFGIMSITTSTPAYRCSLPLWRSSKNSFNLPGMLMSLKLGNRYICRNESIAMSGRSSCDLPKWCSGCAKRLPSAVKKLMFSVKTFNEALKVNVLLGKMYVNNNLRFSDRSSVSTTVLYFLIDSVSLLSWNRIRNGSPSSVNSSAFSNVISLHRIKIYIELVLSADMDSN